MAIASGLISALTIGAPSREASLVTRRGMLCSASDLEEIVGFTATASTNVAGDFEGADPDKPVKLDNGMIFEFTEYQYNYSYRPDVIVFARQTTFEGRTMVLYKLLIDEDLYDATRVR